MKPSSFDHRRLMKRADLAIGRAVKLARGVVEPMDAVGQAGLLQRPLDSKVFRFADPLTENPAKAIERDRACLLPSNEPENAERRSETKSSVEVAQFCGFELHIGQRPARCDLA